MKKKFLHQLNNAVLGGVSVLIFFILNFIWWVFDASTLVPIWVLSLVIIICYLVCIVIYGVCSAKGETTLYRLPEVRNIIKTDDRCIFIVERNDLFTQGSYATICFQDNDDSLETIVGLGYVEAVNSAGCPQIAVTRVPRSDAALKILKEIENTRSCRTSIKIKPCIHKTLFEEALGNE